MTTNDWPEDRTEMLRVLLRRGLTDPEIAERLGVTKGAVSGKRDRMGLKCNPVPRRRGRDNAMVGRTLPPLGEP